MRDLLLYSRGSTAAIRYAAAYLSSNHIPIADYPSPNVTHLLLDIPSFSSGGQLKNGDCITDLLRELPKDICIIGGNLDHPVFSGRYVYDLLQEEQYLYRNAVITAHCALQIALQELPCILSDIDVLIIGWGRIGKCLAHLLRQNGATVWLNIRNPKDRALSQALGYHVLPSSLDVPDPQRIRILFNTVPDIVMDEERIAKYNGSIKIDLASRPGITSHDVIVARGLPGKYAPESSGYLIGQTVLHYLKEE